MLKAVDYCCYCGNSLIQRGLLKIRKEVFDITKHQRKHEYFYAQRWFIDLRLESVDSFKK